VELERIDFSEEPDESASSSVVSMATVGKDWETTGPKRSGCGLVLSPPREAGELPAEKKEERCYSSLGGVTLRLGEDTVRLAPRTELFPLRLQEDAESDFEGVAT